MLLGQGGDDWADGGSEADYVEGGQASDLVLGGTDDDDVVGGSSAGSSTSDRQVGQPDGADNVYGGAGSDLVLGDNGLLTRVIGGPRDWRTDRANATQTARVPGRGVTMHDLAVPARDPDPALRGGRDLRPGRRRRDLRPGRRGRDQRRQRRRLRRGSRAARTASTVTWRSARPRSSALRQARPGPLPAVDGAAGDPGQDDLTGGWARQGYRDGDDTIHGDGSDDFVVADNGSVARVVNDGTTERVYAQRYGTLPHRPGEGPGRGCRARHPPASARPRARPRPRPARSPAPSAPTPCSATLARTCSTARTAPTPIRGGDGDDDVYGELGADVLFGEGGEDAILGDRGGIQDRYEAGTRSTTTTLTMPPAVSFTSRLNGSVSREADLLHDVNGTDFVGGATSAAMPLDGITFGGVDRIRGGDGHDSIHAGAGDDLVNGDTGGDAVFGGRGDDVMWGGLGKACAYTDAVCQADSGRHR